MHRIDVQLTAAAAMPGQPVDPVPAALAADGLDELVMGFAWRNARHGPLSDPARSLFIDAGPYRWAARMGPERAEVGRGWGDKAAGPGDCTVRGPALGLYLVLWNRLEAGDLAAGLHGDRGPGRAGTVAARRAGDLALTGGRGAGPAQS